MMSPVSYWHEEHLDYERLLELLDRESAVFHEGRSPDYEVMRDAVQYLRHYPDRLHHIREDEAFRRLVLRDRALKPVLDRLHQEHRVLAASGERLLTLLEEAAGDAVLERAAIETAVTTYTGYYRAHIATEEKEVMPRAHGMLTGEDWAAVAAAVPRGRDPLFGDDFDAGYGDLRARMGLEAASL
jgi:hemerythrin-like domain-containing protein